MGSSLPAPAIIFLSSFFGGEHGKSEIRAYEAACERRDDRSRGPRKTTLTAAITKVLAFKNMADFVSYDNIDKAPEERERASRSRRRTWSYQTEKRHYAHVDCRACGLHQEHDHRAGADDGAVLVVSRPDADAADARATSCWRASGRSVHRGVHEQVDMVDDPELLELVELEVRELLSKYQFPGDKTPIVKGAR